MQKKETRLKRAVAFFKHFGGYKTFSRQNNPAPFSCKNKPLHRWHMNRRIRDKSELEAHPLRPWMPELDPADHSPKSMKVFDRKDRKDTIPCRTGSVDQMDVTANKVRPESKDSTTSAEPAELCGSNPPCYELLGTDLQRPELSTEGPSRPPSDFFMDLDEPETYDFISPLSPTLTIRESTFTPLSDLVSPISPIDNSFMSELFSPISPVESSFLSGALSPVSPIESPWAQGSIESRLRRPVLSIITNTESFSPKQPSRIRNQREKCPTKHQGLSPNGPLQPRTVNLANGCGMGPFSKSELPTSQTLVKDIRDLFCALNDYWLEKLSSVPGLPAIEARFQANTPIEASLQALQGCFRGVLPRTFTEIFPLTELAFACAYLLYEDDDTYSWDGFFHDVLDWRHAIANEDDRCLFSKVALLIWSPPEMPEVVRQGVAHSKRPLLASLSIPVESNTEMRHEAPFTSADASSFTLQQHKGQQLSAIVQTQTDILDSLKNGKVIGVCSRYLDGNIRPWTIHLLR